MTERQLGGPWLRLTAVAASAGTLVAVVSGSVHADTAHRFLAALALPPLVAFAVAAILRHRRLVPAAFAAILLFGVAALVTSRNLHLALATLSFAATLVVTAAAFRTESAPFGSIRDYVVLTKPTIMSLLLITGFCGMVAGARGMPPALVSVTAMVGLALACGGASALNHVLDQDIDRLMGERTRRRPVASERVTPTHALEFGLALSAASFTLLASTVNVLTATLALAGNLFYVVVYTKWLKRSTVQNIVIGGAAGAIPPLVGWAAATGDVTLPAIMLFLIVFFWTPPHFWALALLIKENYAAAGVPMLPVVRGEQETRKQIVVYSVLLLVIVIVPFALGEFSWIYLGTGLVLTAAFLALAVALKVRPTRRRAATLFHYSLLYLALLFVAVAIDPVLL